MIIGAGPAGLAAGCRLTSRTIDTVILEKGAGVGGLSRTIRYRGNYFDIGGHRFFTKNRDVLRWWHQIMEEDFLKVPRSSRIFYEGKYFDYPIRLKNVLAGLGFFNAVMILASYFKARLFPCRNEENLEQWTVNRFGRKLYQIFFKYYSEKVWGIPCQRISVDWAAERIRGVSLSAAVRNALSGGRNNKVKSLIKTFYFPRLGAGMMYERAAQKVIEQGGQIRCNSEVVRVSHDHKNITRVSCKDALTGGIFEVEGSDFCSSMPVTALVQRMDPPANDNVLQMCGRLRYRSMVMVYLILDTGDFCEDTWIYVHSGQVKVARIQNFSKWSLAMLADPATTSLGMEYFCDEGDGVWRSSDQDLVETAVKELDVLGLARGKAIRDSLVVRVPEAYPVYEKDYREALDVVRSFVGGFSNLQCMGRNGMFHYNGMDHSVLAGFLAAENVLGARHDLWSIDVETWDD